MKQFILVKSGKNQLTFPTLESWNRYYEEFKEVFGEQQFELFEVSLKPIENIQNS